MSGIRRRTFLKYAAAPAAGLAITPASGVAMAPAVSFSAPLQTPTTGRVFLTGDGLSLAPPEHAAVLARIVSGDGFQRDNYLHGGPVQALEARFAALLGKERALF